MAHYAFLNNDATTETLREELDVLYRDMGTLDRDWETGYFITTICSG